MDAQFALKVIKELIKVVIVVGQDVRIVLIQPIVILVLMDIIYIQTNAIVVIQIAKPVKALLQTANLVMMDII